LHGDVSKRKSLAPAKPSFDAAGEGQPLPPCAAAISRSSASTTAANCSFCEGIGTKPRIRNGRIELVRVKPMHHLPSPGNDRGRRAGSIFAPTLNPCSPSHPFFDAKDLVQVRYEMVRRHRVDGVAISESAAAFGVTRPTFYKAQSALQTDGLAGLLPSRRGPKDATTCPPR
jgi:hypothetical protein